jgi:putative membrane protein
MHSGKSYKLSEFIVWTRRNIYKTLFIGIVPVVLYEVADLKWLAIPWTVVSLLGTATAFIVGFKIHKPIIEHGKHVRFGEQF